MYQTYYVYRTKDGAERGAVQAQSPQEAVFRLVGGEWGRSDHVAETERREHGQTFAAAAILRLAASAETGAMVAQAFFMDALVKHGADVPDYKPGDTNTGILARLLKLGEDAVVDAIRAQAEAVADAGEAAMVAQVKDCPFSGAEWFRVAVEIRDALDAAADDAAAFAEYSDDEGEDDGQPSELEEWADYDPNC